MNYLCSVFSFIVILGCSEKQSDVGIIDTKGEPALVDVFQDGGWETGESSLWFQAEVDSTKSGEDGDQVTARIQIESNDGCKVAEYKNTNDLSGYEYSLDGNEYYRFDVTLFESVSSCNAKNKLEKLSDEKLDDLRYLKNNPRTLPLHATSDLPESNDGKLFYLSMGSFSLTFLPSSQNSLVPILNPLDRKFMGVLVPKVLFNPTDRNKVSGFMKMNEYEQIYPMYFEGNDELNYLFLRQYCLMKQYWSNENDVNVSPRDFFLSTSSLNIFAGAREMGKVIQNYYFQDKMSENAYKEIVSCLDQ